MPFLLLHLQPSQGFDSFETPFIPSLQQKHPPEHRPISLPQPKIQPISANGSPIFDPNLAISR
ncbi:hypothetical protein RHGRI_029795 [Rhododendron griersonianum]|uniref:Uncharacterized protein n=1 Tax=Rhododendron griersonianum TaxID=479676 RepID=A0AAV6IP50_9ERIC|nr:hypothetical protein RHGRI_029795 [Rhododendron griersonianum]